MNDDAPEMTPQEIDDALEAQQALVDCSLPALFDAYDEAIEGGFADPVVVLLDCQDPLGVEIARAWLGDEAVDDALADAAEVNLEGEDETTVFAAAFSWSDCCKQIPNVFPYLEEVFQSDPPSDGFLVIGVTSGGASAFTAPLEARPE